METKMRSFPAKRVGDWERREASFYGNCFVYDSFKSLPLRAQGTPIPGNRKSGELGVAVGGHQESEALRNN